MKTSLLLFWSLIFIQCSSDDTIAQLTLEESQYLSEFRKIDVNSQLFMADQEETGEKLILCLTYINKATQEVLPHQKVLFFHTAHDGKYHQSNPNDPTSARLNGTTETDEQGRIYLETILPGNYGGNTENRHIHTTVYGAKPDGYDINFEQFISLMGKSFVEESDQHFLANLIKTKEGKYIGFLTIEVKNPRFH